MEKKEKEKDITLTEVELIQIENFDLKQKLIEANQKNAQLEIQKLQNDFSNLQSIMTDYFTELAKKYGLDINDYVINLSKKSFEKRK